MKSFEEVKNEMNVDLQDCLVTTEEFLEWWEQGSVNRFDGVGDLHDGENFITDGFKVNIFDFILDVAPTMEYEDFIEKYPYVAWYNN